MRKRRRGRTYTAVVLAVLSVLAMAGCSSIENSADEGTADAQTPLTPLASSEIAPVSALDQEDVASINTFFSRWGAYAVAVGTGAEDEMHVYTSVAQLARDWQSCVTEGTGEDTARVEMYLPNDGGLLTVNAASGLLKEASISYDSQSADLQASLSFTIGCNALIYALAWEDDMTGIASIYNDVMQLLTTSGSEMEGAVSYNGYDFTMELDPVSSRMTFHAAEQAG